jgi:4-alpha-glucanotransferase
LRIRLIQQTPERAASRPWYNLLPPWSAGFVSAAEIEIIDALAKVVGIQPSYRDVDGCTRKVSTDSKHALLLSMGLDLSSTGAMQAELHAWRDSEWCRILDPVIVLRRSAGMLPPCPMKLHRSLPTHSLDWRLQSEQGAIFSGTLRLTSLDAGKPHSADDCSSVRVHLPLPPDLADGYHQLTVAVARAEATATLVIAPAAAFVPDWLACGERRWGIACPLFSLWSDTSWGIGDFTDLASLARAARELGASVVGLNPLHAPLAGEGFDPSPYLPSSRLFLNPLHIDVSSISPPLPGQFTAQIAQAQSATLVDYPAVRRLKQEALERAYRSRQHESTAEFRKQCGEPLTHFALFNALQERFAGRPWRDWPSSVRTPRSCGIGDFARECADRVNFHIWTQWIADNQLAVAAAQLSADKADSGLYQDLAVGVSADGADAWANQELYVPAASIGAPPDAFNPAGQNWGTPPPSPLALKTSGYAPFVAMLRANMRHTNVLRIDHVMGLERLYWVPPGAPAKSGAYVQYPLDDLLGILALESHRNRCLVVGEDLGTLPDGFRERMADANVMSYRLLMFERYPNGLFRRPTTYPRPAVATFGTHDLPTAQSWWQGQDIDLRRTAGLSTTTEAEQETQHRKSDRQLLLAALRDQQLIGDVEQPQDFDELMVAIERFLARSTSALMVANLSDMLAEAVQINVPGTVAEHPNWRHRFRLPVDNLAADPLVRRIAAAIAAERQCRPSQKS